MKRFGRIDVLVNNAAYQGKAVDEFEELDAERVERTFRVNILDYASTKGAIVAGSENGTRVGMPHP